METYPISPEGELKEPEIVALKKIHENGESTYHFSIDGELSEVTMSRPSTSGHSPSFTYNIFSGDNKILEADIRECKDAVFVEWIGIPDEMTREDKNSLQIELIDLSSEMLKAVLKIDFPSNSNAIRDQFGYQI